MKSIVPLILLTITFSSIGGISYLFDIGSHEHRVFDIDLLRGHIDGYLRICNSSRVVDVRLYESINFGTVMSKSRVVTYNNMELKVVSLNDCLSVDYDFVCKTESINLVAHSLFTIAFLSFITIIPMLCD